jgi:predicted dehydrogenase
MKIGVAVVGCGLWGRNFLRNFDASGQFYVAAIADVDRRCREEIANERPDLPVFASLDALLESSPAEAVAIATPAATHFECARMALTAERHVLVAKPMTTSGRDAETLCALAEQRRRVLMVDHTYALSAAMQTIRALAARGELADLTRFESVRRNISAARTDVNLLWDLAPHDLSILDAVFGLDCDDVRIESDESSPHDLRVELAYRDGRSARISFGWEGTEKIRVVSLAGPTRTLVWNDLDPEALVTLRHAGSAPEVLSRPSPDETLLAVVEHFAAVIAGRATSLMDGHHGLRVVRMIERMQRVSGMPGDLRRSAPPQSRGDRPDVFLES